MSQFSALGVTFFSSETEDVVEIANSDGHSITVIGTAIQLYIEDRFKQAAITNIKKRAEAECKVVQQNMQLALRRSDV